MNAALPESYGIDPLFIGSLLVLAGILAVAVFYELTQNRIPNWLTFGGIAVGLLAGWLPGGISLGSSLVGFLSGFGALFVFYLFGGMGGGDVKLMGAAGALLGHPMAVQALIYTAFVGCLMAVLVLIWRKDFWARLGRLVRLRKPATNESSKPTTVPYGIAIATGCVLALMSGGY